ncbi:MAG: ABC transporter permease [Chloroflexi bacterium]|nr:ABC transporter permease [Chloroflexota bacterium]
MRNGLAGFGQSFVTDYLPAILLLVALVGAWEMLVRLLDTKPYILPAPSRIWRAFLQIRGTLPQHTRTTVGESLLGLAWAAVVGVALAAIIASLPLVRRVLYPLLVVSQTIPMVALAPLLIVWFGFGLTPKIIIVALFGFFPIVVSTVDGLTGADAEMVGLVRSMGASRLQELRHVRIPAAIPAFFAGLKIAAAYAVTGAVIGEWLGGSGSGLGLVITRSQASYRTDRLFVAVTFVALASVALFGAVHLLARLASPWMYVTKKEGPSR